MELRLANDSDEDRWNAYVEGTSQTPPSNRFEWRQILGCAYGLDTRFWLALGPSDDVQGVLGAYLIRDPKRRKRLYTVQHGFLADDAEVASQLLDRAHRDAREEGVVSLEITSGFHQVMTPMNHRPKTTVVLPLEETAEATWDALRNKTRNMVRKAQDAGVTLAEGFRYLDEFHAIYADHLASMGVPVHTPRFFEEVERAFGSDAELLVARRNGETIGGTLLIYGRTAGTYPCQSSRLEARDHAPNPFMTWEAAKRCAERGLRELDMGEATPGGGVYNFKTNFGGEPREVHNYQGMGAPEAQVDGLVDAICRHVPLSFATEKALEHAPLWLRRRVAQWARSRRRAV